MARTISLEQRRHDYRELRRLEYAYARDDLGLFTQAAWDVLEPKVELKWNWHHDYIAEHLEACKLGQIKRLLINVMPRSTKSILSTVCFPDYVWASQPESRWLFGSYADELATYHSVLRRNLIESQWYQDGWGHKYQLSSDVNTKSEFTNDEGGEQKAGGINACPIGRGGDYIVIDDPHNPAGAESDDQRATALFNFDQGWSMRLNDKKTGVIIIVMQRLHEDDLSGHVLTKELGYTHVKLQTVAEERERLVFPVTGRIIEREPGDLMHPERDGPAEIAQMRKTLGEDGYAGQLQQSPRKKGGNLFTEAMFTIGPVSRLPEDYLFTFITADTAYKDKQQNDFQVFSYWGVKQAELCLIDCLRDRIKAADVERICVPFIKSAVTWGFVGAYVEPKGHGIYLNQKLPGLGVPMPPEEEARKFFADRNQNKTQRGSMAVPFLSARKVVLNEALHQVNDLKAEALNFPKGKHDDFVDTLIDAVKRAYAHPASILDA